MPDSMIGFRAKLSVNDGAGSPPAQAEFTKAIKIMIPAREYGEYEEKVLTTPTKDRKFYPTLIDNGTCSCEGYFTKAEYTRLVALLGVQGKVWKVIPPDEDGTGVQTAQTQILDGWLKKVGEVTFEKDVEVKVAFDIRVNGITTENALNETVAM